MPLFYHEFPNQFEATVEPLEARPGRVLVKESPLYPGGGGQLADRGAIECDSFRSAVTGIERTADGIWISFADARTASGPIVIRVDETFRRLMSQLHTASHVLNAVVFSDFDGALVTGVQLGEDGVGRMDFDLPDCDNDKLRKLEEPINSLFKEGLDVVDDYIPTARLADSLGLVRTKTAMPPILDDAIRVVKIVGLDEQVCGGTHVANTGLIPPFRILKIENKGRSNRRVRFGVCE